MLFNFFLAKSLFRPYTKSAMKLLPHNIKIHFTFDILQINSHLHIYVILFWLKLITYIPVNFHVFFVADQDGAEPCGNSIAVHNLIRLAVYLDRNDLREKAGLTLTAFASQLDKIPIALPEMVSALLCYHFSPYQVCISC